MAKENHSFPASEKLKSRKQIALLFKEGKRFSQFPYQAIFLVTKGTYELGAGFGVSSRSFKKAVDRNRIKRLGREAYRLSNASLKERMKASNTGLNVFFNYVGKELPDFYVVKEKMESILKKLEKECS